MPATYQLGGVHKNWKGKISVRTLHRIAKK